MTETDRETIERLTRELVESKANEQRRCARIEVLEGRLAHIAAFAGGHLPHLLLEDIAAANAAPSAPALERSKEWWIAKAKAEGASDVGAGADAPRGTRKLCPYCSGQSFISTNSCRFCEGFGSVFVPTPSAPAESASECPRCVPPSPLQHEPAPARREAEPEAHHHYCPRCGDLCTSISVVGCECSCDVDPPAPRESLMGSGGTDSCRCGEYETCAVCIARHPSVSCEPGEVTHKQAKAAVEFGPQSHVLRAYIRQQAERERKVAALVTAVRAFAQRFGGEANLSWTLRDALDALATPTTKGSK